MLPLSEQLLFTTVRLEGNTTNGVSIGTGLFFKYKERLFLITNKHVVESVSSGHFSMLRSKIATGIDEPIIGTDIKINFNANSFIGHPDPNIDIAAMNISEEINKLMNSGITVFRKTITEDILPKKDDYDKYISPIEDVVFIGYPTGLYDSVNNLPLIRRGITATPCYYNFNGQRVFLIDASVFPGSSGSPVFIYYSGTYHDKDGNAYIGNRIYFLGIIARVYQHQEKGKITVINIPSSQTLGAEFNQMIDIGLVFKAETIIETMEYYLASISKRP